MFPKAAHMSLEEEVLKLRKECRFLRQKVAILERAHLAQKKKSSKLEELLKQRDKFIKELEREKEELEKLIDELKRQRDTYKGMIFKASKNSKKNLSSTVEILEGRKKKRLPGGQKGHKGYGRNLPKKADIFSRIFFHHCPDCGTRLKRSKAIVSHTIEDLPLLSQVKPVVTHYDKERQYCPKCQKEVVASPDGVIPNSRLGMNLIIKVLIMRYLLGQPFKKIADHLKVFYNIKMSSGTLVNILYKTKKHLGKDYDNLLKRIRNSKVKHADETGWRIAGENNWCWAFLTKNSVYYTIEHSRGKGVADKILSASKKDHILVRDDYRGYEKLQLHHQSCWAHLLRKSHEHCSRDKASKQIKLIHKKLKAIYRVLDKTLKQSPDPPMRKLIYQKVWQQLEKIINSSYKELDAKKIQTRIRNQGKNLLTALLYENVPLTNNLAERTLRPMVVTRKISGGSRTDNGAAAHAVNMSIIQTLKMRDKPLVPVLHKMLFKRISSKPSEKTE